jgi:hypothetical protein
VIANPGSRRIQLFQEALAALCVPPARVVAWHDLLAGTTVLSDVVGQGDIVRIESPGRDFEVERAILAAGATVIDEEEGYERLAPEQVSQLSFDKGRILAPRQWYLGFRYALQLVTRQLAACPPHRLLNDPAEIALMFDKRACHARLWAAGIPVPPALTPPRSHQELVEYMRLTGRRRVFVKSAHGSSASGVAAYQTDGRRGQAVSTVEMIRRDGVLHLYNSRRIRVYRDLSEIAALIDALCGHRVHVEQWLPKAAYAGRVFDLRVLVIAGRAHHVVVRAGTTPMTNLHLLNTCGEPEVVRERMGDDAWTAGMDACERAMALFPRSLHGGVDLLVSPDFKRHAILEVNAFGDLLPGVAHQGQDTYTAQIIATRNWAPPHPWSDRSAPAMVTIP